MSDAGNNRIVVLDHEGMFMEQIGSGRIALEDGNFSESSFNRQQGLAYDDLTDSLYVAGTNEFIAVKDNIIFVENIQRYWGVNRHAQSCYSSCEFTRKISTDDSRWIFNFKNSFFEDINDEINWK